MNKNFIGLIHLITGNTEFRKGTTIYLWEVVYLQMDEALALHLLHQYKEQALKQH